MKLGNLGEFALISRISSLCHPLEGITGIGDDCAVIPQCEGMDTLVSTDMLVEGTHFILDDISPRQLGWKSAAVNLSDIAAMGGRPVGTFLSIALPERISVEWVDSFVEGYKAVSDLCGATLLGGDTTSSPSLLCINVTVTGECPSGKSKRRDMAQEGDLVCVTGPLGDSSCGLRLLLDGFKCSDAERELIRRHYEPMPRVCEGLALSSCSSVHAMMDISDGIASDLVHILEASGKGAVVDVSKIPLSSQLKDVCLEHGWDPLNFALGGGEDYELLFTMSSRGPAPEIPYHVIGEITPSRELELLGTDRKYKGFTHF